VRAGRGMHPGGEVWYSDLGRGFTRIADAHGAKVVLAMLNDYAEALGRVDRGAGRHVLKFIGDGMLAIFPDRDESNGCERALDAAGPTRGAGSTPPERDAPRGRPAVSDATSRCTSASCALRQCRQPAAARLHGARRAVNEAARIEAYAVRSTSA